MAPEMLGGNTDVVDERTDVFLLGATLYELVTGKPPHSGKTLVEVLYSIENKEVSVPGDLPSELQSDRARIPHVALLFRLRRHLRARSHRYRLCEHQSWFCSRVHGAQYRLELVAPNQEERSDQRRASRQTAPLVDADGQDGY